MLVTVIADAKYPNMFRVRLDDGATSDMLNHGRAHELARLWALKLPVRRKPVRVPEPPSPADASTAAPSIVLTVMPSRNPDGTRAYTKRGPLFDGKVDGRTIITRSTQPLLDGCRVLIREGVDPDTRITMRHAGSTADALRSTVGGAAKLIVEEGARVPQVRRWKPSPHADVTPPMRQPSRPSPDQPQAPERPSKAPTRLCPLSWIGEFHARPSRSDVQVDPDARHRRERAAAQHHLQKNFEPVPAHISRRRRVGDVAPVFLLRGQAQETTRRRPD